MLFNFCLTPVENVPAFRRGNDLHLHWFGLTYGCYWLQAGDVELFRASEKILKKPGWDKDYFGCPPHIDYQVARLWEDILDILPDVLSPVHQAVTEKLAAPNFRAWRAMVERWINSEPHRLDEPAYENATEWIRKRHLDTLYLIAGPRVWIWNDGVHIHLEWDNRDMKVDGIPVWSASMGSWQLKVETFLDEVRAFDSAFIQAMQRRVEQVATGWTRPDVHIDIDWLIQEQSDRATWLAQSLANAQKPSDDWNTILNAIAFIDSELKP